MKKVGLQKNFWSIKLCIRLWFDNIYGAVDGKDYVALKF